MCAAGEEMGFHYCSTESWVRRFCRFERLALACDQFGALPSGFATVCTKSTWAEEIKPSTVRAFGMLSATWSSVIAPAFALVNFLQMLPRPFCFYLVFPWPIRVVPGNIGSPETTLGVDSPFFSAIVLFKPGFLVGF